MHNLQRSDLVYFHTTQKYYSPDGRVSLGMQGMVGNLVLGNVIERILQRPVRDGVALGQSTSVTKIDMPNLFINEYK